MQDYLKLACAALIAAVLALTLKKHHEALAVTVAAAGCCVCGVLLVNIIKPVISFAEQISVTAGISQEVISPLLKSLGVGLLTQFSADFCTDAGQTSLARAAQTGGMLMCLCISLPLLQSVLSLVQTMIGG